MSESNSAPKRRTRPEPRGISSKEIDSSLKAIYQDENGKLPSMAPIKKPEQTRGLFSCFLFIGVITALSLWAFVFKDNGSSTGQGGVSVSIEGAAELSIDVTSTYRIHLSNKSGAALSKATLNLNYPEGFLFLSSDPQANNTGHNEWRLTDFAPGEQKTITVNVKPYGTLGEQKTWRAFFAYQPSNVNSELQKIAALPVTLNDTPINLSLAGPDRVAVGTEARYTFTIQNKKSSLGNLTLVPQVPANFTITSSSPALIKNRWPITLSNKNANYVLIGKFSNGTAGAIKGSVILASGSAGYSIASAVLNPEITESKSQLKVAINGATDSISAVPGDTLHITIEFKNTSSEELKNAALRLIFEAPAEKKQSLLAWSQIKDPYDGDIQGEQISDTKRRGEIIWNSKKIPALQKIKPGADIAVELSLPIKNARDFNLGSISDPNITVLSSLDYIDKQGEPHTIEIVPLNIKLESGLFFIGSHTNSSDVHTITWSLTNDVHILKKVQLTAEVFGAVTITPGKADLGELTYNTETKKLNWYIESLPPATGETSAIFTATITKPNPTQSLLLSKTTISATDSVTGETIQKSGAEVKLLQ